MEHIQTVRESLLKNIETAAQPRDVLKTPELKELYSAISTLDPSERAAYGKAVNDLKNELEAAIQAREDALESVAVEAIDITAPWDVNGSLPQLLPTEQASQHPLTRE